MQNGEYKLVPNQYGEFCLPNDLYNDTGIEASLKDIGSQLVTDYYEILCNTSVKISCFLKTKSQKDVIEEINNYLISEDTNEDDKRIAVYSLTSLFPPVETTLYQTKNLIFEISKKVFKDHTFEKQFIDKWSPDIWEISDKIQVEYITFDISEYENLLNLSNALSESNAQVREWLSVFVGLIVEQNWNYLLIDDSPIVPNQNGTFCDINDLFAEGEPIDESLKNIALQLRRDFRDELIDIAFKVKIPKNRHKFQKDIAIEIRSLVTPLLSEVSRKPQTQSIFNELIIWMDSNQDLAKELFEDLFENRHKLYDDAEVASNLRKVRDLEREIINLRQTNSNLKNENDQLKAEIEKLKENIDTSDRKDISLAMKEIDEDFLIAYGVTNIDQINSIISDPRISQKYILSFQAFDMVSKLQYVLEIIERAKINVRQYLESHAEYDCSGWYEVGTTHITGILKHHQKIDIIVRPSDNKKIVFYYPDETQTLSLSNSELWVEDGNSNPQQITLGVVLQIEGIECLYLR